MRTYYRGRDAVVTSDHFIHRTPASTRAFLVCDLREVCIAQAPTASLSVPLVTGAALVTLAVTASLWHVSVPYAMAFLGLSGFAATCATLFLRIRPRPLQLRGTYRGKTVALYESADARVFNQVSRALRRALEDNRPPRSSDDVSAA